MLSFLFNLIVGTKGPDALIGSSGNDIIIGGNGDDFVRGANGNDVVLGGRGNDTLGGGAGKDLVFGGAGNDYITGGMHNDLLIGGAGDDTIVGSGGTDWLWGGSGKDKFRVDATGDNNVIIDFSFKQGDRIDLPPGYSLANAKIVDNGFSLFGVTITFFDDMGVIGPKTVILGVDKASHVSQDWFI